MIALYLLHAHVFFVGTRNRLICGALKQCAIAQGSRWSLEISGELKAGKKGSKKAAVKKITDWPSFCGFLRSLRVLRQSRGLSGVFLKRKHPS